MKVLITGIDGFIGKNLSTQLSTYKDLEILGYHRKSTQENLQQALSQADFICHLAGANRPLEIEEFNRVNRDLTEILCQEIEKLGRSIPILFTSSIQADQKNPYGISKLAAEQILLDYSKKTDAPVYLFRLPNVFGKWCRPNYNSVVATFCHNIAHHLPIQIHDPQSSLKLVYIDDVIKTFIEIITQRKGNVPYPEVQPIYSISVGELAEQIEAFQLSRNSLISERVGVGLTRALYATYMSYLSPQDFAYKIPQYGDPRGVFVEMLKTKDSGQFSFFTAHPGVTRGEHYHHSKTEKFLVIRGNAKFCFRHLMTQETYEISTSGDQAEIVETIPGWAHNITNIGTDEMIVMIWANEIFDRDHPDTYASSV